MVVGIDSSRAFRAHKTGVEWYSYHVIRGLAQIDHKNRYQLYSDVVLPEAEKTWLPENFNYRRLRWPIKSLWTQGRLSWEMRRRPSDVLFVPAHVIPSVHPQKTVNTVHDVGFLDYPEGYSEKQLQYLKWSTRLAIKTCKKIITVSHFTKQALIERFDADADRIFVTHLGYDRERYVPGHGNTEITERYGIVGPYIFYSGRLEPRKNIETLLKIFELLRTQGIEISLVIAGPLGFKGDTYLEMIKRHPYSQAIRYVGWVSEEDKIGLLQNAFAMIFPSFYEGFGLPLIEAQACGVPVVCSDTTSLPEVGGDGALFFNPRQPEEAAGYIATLSRDLGRRQRLIKKGIENAQRFDWVTTAQQTQEILTQW